MRFVMLVRADKNTEAGVLPSKGGRHRAVQRGGGEGRRAAGGRGDPTELEGRAHQVFARNAHRDRRAVSREGADRRRVPFADGEAIEIRQVFEASDFPPEVLPPQDAARERAMREELRRKQGA